MSQEPRTARDVLVELEKLDKQVVAAHVDGTLVDLHAPISADAQKVKAVRADHPDALALIRHSSAHVMADAVQRLFPGTKVAFGPAIDGGFYYDYDRESGSFTDEDLRAIEAKMQEIIGTDAAFERQVVTKDEARALLRELDEPYKLEHLERLEGEITLYRHGEWVDLCEGPHVPSTRFLKAIKLTSVAGAYWRGDESNPMLQRIYGTAFPSPKALRVHLKRIEEAKKRDHRKLGKELDLIGFHPLAPASPFFLPKGAALYNTLVGYVRDLYVGYGYDEVVTPEIFDTELFHRSGHLPGYADAMYLAASNENIDKAAESIAAAVEAGEKLGAEELRAKLDEAIRYGVKPMNCPCHCLIFGMELRSYRDLPMRVADFGRLHRYERSGVVQGLTRVRTFAQDDGHIFCTLDQLEGEITGFLDLVYDVYRDFGFSEVRLVVATRPDKRLGSDDIWDKAEAALIDGCKVRELPYEIADGEGAFYGPKLEFHLKDAIGRSWQLGTIQLDFNLPERFDLNYIGSDNTKHRPVMLHRAILGSIERFMGVLIEHVGGNFPTWLAPEQVRVVAVRDEFSEYAVEAKAALEAVGLRVSADFSDENLGKKISAGRHARIPYIAVVGAKEQEGRGLALRSRDENKDLGFMPLDDVIERLRVEALPPSKRPS